jgi:hypothetical protein
MVNKARTSAFGAGSVTAAKISAPVDIPKISSIVYIGDDTATNSAGGDTITVNGSFFKPGCYVYVDRTQASVVSFISSSQITFTAPAKSAGTYTLYIYNPDGGTAIYIPGMNYSGTPTWSTASGSIGTAYETVELSSNVTVLSASSDSTVKYRLYSGSFPTNAVLNANTGAITGVTTTVAGVTTYTFVIEAYDLENQGTFRTFSITINPDVVTWSSPADGTLYNANVGSVFTQSLSATSVTGKSISYSANTLPGGLSISGNTITGTLTTQANTTSLITATATTSNKTATRTLLFYIKTVPDQPTIGTATQTGQTTATVTFTAPAYDGNSPIVQYIATSSPGNVTGTLNQAGSGTITVSGLTAGTNYTFTVKAVNAAGQSVASVASNQITTAPATPSSVEYLIVAGGGGGGHGRGGGGGAGGYRTSTLSVSANTAYTVTVGGGGGGSSSTIVSGSDGSPSTFASITSIGGGGGGSVAISPTQNGRPGGSGGGAGDEDTTSGTAGAGTPGQGNNGGIGQGGPSWSGAAGGGGGAISVGQNAPWQLIGGAGGSGAPNSITGLSVTYSGGGGGGSVSGGTAGSGGTGGGGNSGNPGGVGGTNLGGGGGGGHFPGQGNGNGGAGGSGVVIIAYPTASNGLTSINPGLTYDTPSGRPGFRVYRFTGGSGPIQW